MHERFLPEWSGDYHFDDWPLERHWRLRESRQRCLDGRPLAKDRSKSRFQYSVELPIGDETHSAAERTFVRTAIVLFKRTLIIHATLLERDGRIKIQVGGPINDREVMVRQVDITTDTTRATPK